MRHLLFLITAFLFTSATSQTPCENGIANGYLCFGIDLQAIVSPDELGAESIGDRRINDLWGWTDPLTDKEYAIVGMVNGTSFVDISDPLNPVVLGVLKEHNWDVSSADRKKSLLHDGAKSVWRDIKVYQNYAYVVSEDPNHGIQVFDLTDLRDVSDPPADFQEAGHYDGVGKAHNLFINEETGFLYAVGFNQQDRTCSEGGLHIVDLADPVNPAYAGCFDQSGYIHDTQCVIYDGPDTDYAGKEICFNSNATETSNTITITDVSNKSQPLLIKKGTYSSSFYTHQGWLTEDHRYFISNDELDEIHLQQKTKTFIWDVQDLDNPTLIGTYVHNTKAIDHNLYIHNQKIYQSNYTNGLRILSTSRVSEGILSEEMFFDVHPTDDITDFWGTWSNYPFFESGNIIVSDFARGLFILRPQEITLASEEANAFIYPNPALGEVTITLKHTAESTVELIGMDGKIVHSRSIRERQNKLDLTGIDSGIYLIMVKSGGKKSVQRLLVR